MKKLFLSFVLFFLFVSFVFADDGKVTNIHDDIFNRGVDCYLDKDYSCARNSFETLQEMNFDSREYNGFVEMVLGKIYLHGQSVEPNPKLASELIQVSYEISDSGKIKSLAATNLAWIYNTDIDLRDYSLSKKWAEISILYPDSTYALNNYGVFIEEGIIFEKNDALAFEYYKLASEADDPVYYSFSNLGRFYALGKGNVRKSKERSMEYFTKAIEIGGKDDATTSTSFMRIINRFNRLPRDIQEASLWLEEDIYKYGSSNFLILGWLHDDEDLVEALKWFVLQEWLGEDIQDRDRARELIDRTKALLNFDQELINKAETMAFEWKEKYWDNYDSEKNNYLDSVEWGNYYALLIANSDYINEFLPDLETPRSDVQEIESILKNKYNFKTKLLIDSTSEEIYNAIYSYRDILEEKDNLLIYYAGHGSLDKSNGVGYWQPIDAEIDKPWTWISNQSITDVIKSMRANHIIVIADSCYSGTFVYRGGEDLYKPKEDKNLTIFYKKKKSKKARLALTSGDYQPVPDSLDGKHSPFAKSLILTLEQNDQVLLSSKLHVLVENQLALESIFQEPLYGAILNSNHREGADFIFLPSQAFN